MSASNEELIGQARQTFNLIEKALHDNNSVEVKARPPIDPLKMSSVDLKNAVGQLVGEASNKIVGVVKSEEPVKEDQSPEAVRRANLKSLKAKRRDIITSLIEIEKEIYQLEEITSDEAYNPVEMQAKILEALEGTRTILGTRSFTLKEVREHFPHPEISYASWMTELKRLQEIGRIFLSVDFIVMLKQKES